jgi:hypothetical protein
MAMQSPARLVYQALAATCYYRDRLAARIAVLCFCRAGQIATSCRINPAMIFIGSHQIYLFDGQ